MNLQPLDNVLRSWTAQHPGYHVFGGRIKQQGKRVWKFQLFAREQNGALVVESAKGDSVSAFIDDDELKGLTWPEISHVLWDTFDMMLPEIAKGGRSHIQAHAS